MAGKGGAPPVPIEAQILVQEIRSRRDAMTASSSSSELDRERKSLEPSADAGHDRSTLVGQLEAAAGGSSALHEQLHGRKRSHVHGCQAGVRLRARQQR